MLPSNILPTNDPTRIGQNVIPIKIIGKVSVLQQYFNVTEEV